MFRIVYLSSATKEFAKDELLALLGKARDNNSQLGITGMLLYKDGNFMQLLEGEKSVVLNLYTRISRDPRHRGLIVVVEEAVNERLFSQWSMGFRNLKDQEVLAMPGYSNFLNHHLAAEEFINDPSGCINLLTLFKTK